MADRRTERLSGGETQRLRFAVALVSDPDLLVLDEPTVGMDVEAGTAFWATMRGSPARGKTVLFATHYLEEADAYADRAVLMARGRIVADGPTTEIKALVGTRTIRATLAGVPIEALERLPGGDHGGAPRRGGRPVVLRLRRTRSGPSSTRTRRRRHRDRAAPGLEEAFLQLTADDEEEVAA